MKVLPPPEDGPVASDAQCAQPKCRDLRQVVREVTDELDGDLVELVRHPGDPLGMWREWIMKTRQKLLDAL